MKKIRSSHFLLSNSKAKLNMEYLGLNSPGMLLVWADYCHYCHEFKPTYKRLSERLGKQFPCLEIERADISQALNTALQVEGYPSLFFFDQQGNIIEKFKGRREPQVLLRHICKVYHHCINYH